MTTGATGTGQSRGQRDPAVKRVPAKERVYEYVRDRLFGGDHGDDSEVPTEEWLTEEAVAAELGVSRTPVREAFLKLEADGFIILIPRKGVFVRPVSGREIREVMQARELIECWSVERSLDRLEPEEHEQLVEALRSLLDEQAELVEQREVHEFIKSDRRFHQTIVRAAANRILADLYDRLRDRQVGIAVRAILRDARRLENAYAEHGRIFAAFARRDAAETCAALVRHLEVTAEIFDEADWRGDR